jgi:intron-binding protein aquarius
MEETLQLPSWDAATFDPALVARVYSQHLCPTLDGAGRAAEQLGARGYLEYLWQHVRAAQVPSDEHVLSVLALAHERSLSAPLAWAALGGGAPDGGRFASLFSAAVALRARESLHLLERRALLSFWVQCFASLEQPIVACEVLRLASLPLWHAVAPHRRELEFARAPALKRAWAKLEKEGARLEREVGAAEEALRAAEVREAAAVPAAPAAPAAGRRGRAAAPAPVRAPKRRRGAPVVEEPSEGGGEGGGAAGAPAEGAAPSAAECGARLSAARAAAQRARLDAGFLPSLLSELLGVLASIPPPPAAVAPEAAAFCERGMELVVDLLAQLPTRRFFKLLIDDSHFLLLAHGNGLTARAGRAPGAARAQLTQQQPAASSAGLLGGAVLSVAAGEGEDEGAAEPLLQHGGGGGGRDATSGEGRVYCQLLARAKFFAGFEVDEHSGEALSEADMDGAFFNAIGVLQRLVFKHCAPTHPELREFALGSVKVVSATGTLRAFLEVLPDASLVGLARRLRLLPLEGAAAGSEGGAGAAPAGACARAAAAAAAARAAEPVPAVRPPLPHTRGTALAVLLAHHARRPSQLAALNALPLYPTEALLWDPARVPPGARFLGDAVYALPKLNLQFLSLYDYLLRSWELYRLESAYEIRCDVVDAVKRLAPVRGGGWGGWARMALPLHPGGVALRDVAPPRPGASAPARVTAELAFSLRECSPALRREWDALREHDVVFLITVRSPVPPGTHADALRDPQVLRRCVAEAEAAGGGGGGGGGGSAPPAPAPPRPPRAPGAPPPEADEEDFTFPARYGIVAVRGAEVEALLDEKGHNFGDPSSGVTGRRDGSGGGEPRAPVGDRRTLRLLLDPAQFVEDGGASGNGVLRTFNLLLRRDGKSNNFRAVLEAIRDSMNAVAGGNVGGGGRGGGREGRQLDGGLPAWLCDVLLGYGAPNAAHYTSLPPHSGALDFGDTFLSAAHLRGCFPGTEVAFFDEDSGAPLEEAAAAPPFRLRFSRGAGGREAVAAFAYAAPLRVALYEAPGARAAGRNSVPFTAAQVEAVRGALCPGLTLVIGPPGSGKTDTAVQAVALLLRNAPASRVLLVAHSNAALNDLFAKLLERGVAPRHLLRLGAGERELEVEGDYSKAGRVAAALGRRASALAVVAALGASIGVPGDVGYTCETAEHFCTHHVKPRVDAFRTRFGLPPPPPPAADADAGAAARATFRAAAAAALAGTSAADVAAAFPFATFFAAQGAPPLAAALGGTVGAAAEAEARFAALAELFEEIASCKAFEVLRSQRARVDYLLLKEARVVAMTTTHAAISRARMRALGFHYDSVVMEEAAQVSEVETFIPLVCQDPVTGASPLKRVVLIGDHHQLPPVVMNVALARWGGLNQSMFARLLRLGVPAVQLSAQGRARPQLAALYAWRYAAGGGLANLRHVVEGPAYVAANAALAAPLALVDVPDYQGHGESTPAPHYYQNLGEAEFLVALFMYMRLHGYPASSIAILATYNGQVALLKDVVARRCAGGFYGVPAAISTVDRK